MNQQNRIPVGRINGTEIFAVADQSGETFVPIKPICKALGIDFAAQYNKIKEDPDLSSVIVLSTTTGADSKDYDMACLPLKYVFGWLFTINPKKVHPVAQEAVRKYRMECYDILYRHFSGRSGKLKELDDAERETVARIGKLDKAIREAQEALAGIKSERSGEKERLEKIRAARLDDKPSLFD